MPQKPNLKDINGLELDRRVWAYDEDRRIAEIALKGRLEGEWEWVKPRVISIASNEQPMTFTGPRNIYDSANLEYASQILSN